MNYLIFTSSPSHEIEAAWNDCLNSSRYATRYTAPEFFSEIYFRSRKRFAILAMEDGLVHGLVTGFGQGDRLECGHSGSPQLCIRDGADTARTVRALIDGLRKASAGGAHFISVYCWSEIPEFERAGFRCRKLDAPLGTVVLDLSKGSEALFRQFSETRRNKIRRAIRAKVEVGEMNIPRDFDEYYAIYCDWCSYKGLTAQPYALQRSAFESDEDRLVLVARHCGRVVGVSTFRYRRPGIMEYASNVSRRSDTRLRQNDLLLWRAIEWAASRDGIRLFSTAAAHYFLQKLGGELRPTYRYSMDCTIFRRYHFAERIRETAHSAYRLLPQSTRNRLKHHFARHSGQD